MFLQFFVKSYKTLIIQIQIDLFFHQMTQIEMLKLYINNRGNDKINFDLHQSDFFNHILDSKKSNEGGKKNLVGSFDRLKLNIFSSFQKRQENKIKKNNNFH